jgi:hypothetical protein
MLYPQRVSLVPLKKCNDMFSAVCDVYPVSCNSPLQMKMDIWLTFFEFELAGPLQTIMAVWRGSNLKKVRQTAITFSSYPTRSLSRTVCRGKEGPKGSKSILRPDIQANT